MLPGECRWALNRKRATARQGGKQQGGLGGRLAPHLQLKRGPSYALIYTITRLEEIVKMSSLHEALADYLEFTFQNATLSLPREQWFSVDTMSADEKTRCSEYGYSPERTYTLGTRATRIKISFPNVSNEKDASDPDTPLFETPTVEIGGASMGSGDNYTDIPNEIRSYFLEDQEITLTPVDDCLILETHSQIPFRWLYILKEFCPFFKDAVIELKGKPPIRDAIMTTPSIVLNRILNFNRRSYVAVEIQTDDWAVRNFTDPEKRECYVYDMIQKRYVKHNKEVFCRGILAPKSSSVIEKSGDLMTLENIPYKAESESSANILLSSQHAILWSKLMAILRPTEDCSPVISGRFKKYYGETADMESDRHSSNDPAESEKRFYYHTTPGVLGEELFILQMVLTKYGIPTFIPTTWLS